MSDAFATRRVPSAETEWQPEHPFAPSASCKGLPGLNRTTELSPKVIAPPSVEPSAM
jgi:hypothetical protein